MDINHIKINRKVIVWKDFQQSYVLEGHQAAVWAVLAVEDDLILTGKQSNKWLGRAAKQLY